jgi:hypothetical protein
MIRRCFRITSIGIPGVIMIISLGIRIRGWGSRSHLTPEEEHQPDQEGTAYNQWRSQRCQIREHAGLLSPSCLRQHPHLALSLIVPAGPIPASPYQETPPPPVGKR